MTLGGTFASTLPNFPLFLPGGLDRSFVYALLVSNGFLTPFWESHSPYTKIRLFDTMGRCFSSFHVPTCAVRRHSPFSFEKGGIVRFFASFPYPPSLTRKFLLMPPSMKNLAWFLFLWWKRFLSLLISYEAVSSLKPRFLQISSKEEAVFIIFDLGRLKEVGFFSFFKFPLPYFSRPSLWNSVSALSRPARSRLVTWRMSPPSSPPFPLKVWIGKGKKDLSKKRNQGKLCYKGKTGPSSNGNTLLGVAPRDAQLTKG